MATAIQHPLFLAVGTAARIGVELARLEEQQRGAFVEIDRLLEQLSDKDGMLAQQAEAVRALRAQLEALEEQAAKDIATERHGFTAYKHQVTDKLRQADTALGENERLTQEVTSLRSQLDAARAPGTVTLSVPARIEPNVHLHMTASLCGLCREGDRTCKCQQVVFAAECSPSYALLMGLIWHTPGYCGAVTFTPPAALGLSSAPALSWLRGGLSEAVASGDPAAGGAPLPVVFEAPVGPAVGPGVVPPQSAALAAGGALGAAEVPSQERATEDDQHGDEGPPRARHHVFHEGRVSQVNDSQVAGEHSAPAGSDTPGCGSSGASRRGDLRGSDESPSQETSGVVPAATDTGHPAGDRSAGAGTSEMPSEVDCSGPTADTDRQQQGRAPADSEQDAGEPGSASTSSSPWKIDVQTTKDEVGSVAIVLHAVFGVCALLGRGATDRDAVLNLKHQLEQSPHGPHDALSSLAAWLEAHPAMSIGSVPAEMPAPVLEDAAEMPAPPGMPRWLRAAGAITYHLFYPEALSAHCDEDFDKNHVELGAEVSPHERLCTEGCRTANAADVIAAAEAIFAKVPRVPKPGKEKATGLSEPGCRAPGCPITETQHWPGSGVAPFCALHGVVDSSIRREWNRTWKAERQLTKRAAPNTPAAEASDGR
jgi:hypothetical protein